MSTICSAGGLRQLTNKKVYALFYVWNATVSDIFVCLLQPWNVQNWQIFKSINQNQKKNRTLLNKILPPLFSTAYSVDNSHPLIYTRIHAPCNGLGRGQLTTYFIDYYNIPKAEGAGKGGENQSWVATLHACPLADWLERGLLTYLADLIGPIIPRWVEIFCRRGRSSASEKRSFFWSIFRSSFIIIYSVFNFIISSVLWLRRCT